VKLAPIVARLKEPYPEEPVSAESLWSAGITTATTATTTVSSTAPHWTNYVSLDFDVRMSTGDALKSLFLPHDQCAFITSDFFCHVKEFDQVRLTEGGLRIKNLPNAGGTSMESEAMSFEVLKLMLGAQLSRTEMELEYYPLGSKITDFSVICFAQNVGVSVTRAMKFRGIFTVADAKVLLKKKLYGVTASTQAVVQEKWPRQILHIWAEHPYVADVLREAFNEIDSSLKSNTIVVVTVCHNAEWIF